MAVDAGDDQPEPVAEAQRAAVGAHEAAAVGLAAPTAAGEVLAAHQTAQREQGGLDDQAGGPHVDDDPVEDDRLAGPAGEPLEELEQHQPPGFLLGRGRAALGLGKVGGNLGKPTLRRRRAGRLRRVGQQRPQRPVDEQVRVAADRTGEVAVVGHRQPVMTERVRPVAGPLQALEQPELDRVLVRPAAGGV